MQGGVDVRMHRCTILEVKATTYNYVVCKASIICIVVIYLLMKQDAILGT